MAEIVTTTIKVTTAGGDGSATGSTVSDKMVPGFLLDVYIDYHADAPATTDVTVAFTKRGGNILQVTDNKTDGLYHPRAKPVDNANSAITNAHDKFAVNDKVTVSVAQSDALTDAVTVYLRTLRP